MVFGHFFSLFLDAMILSIIFFFISLFKGGGGDLEYYDLLVSYIPIYMCSYKGGYENTCTKDPPPKKYIYNNNNFLKINK